MPGAIEGLESDRIALVEGAAIGGDHDKAIDSDQTAEHSRALFFKSTYAAIVLVTSPEKTAPIRTPL